MLFIVGHALCQASRHSLPKKHIKWQIARAASNPQRGLLFGQHSRPAIERVDPVTRTGLLDAVEANGTP